MLVQHAYAPHSGQLRQLPTSSECVSLGGGDPLLARAMALAGVGVWSCNLSDGGLSWTSGIYDLFGLPADMPLDRRQVIEMYAEESREAMEKLRAQAIARCGTFTLDAQIVRRDGGRRWMRLTGEMVSHAGRTPRLHGLKQDITEEKLRWEAMRRLAENDALTGLASRAVYESQFLNSRGGAGPIVPLGALVLFDLDGFKGINDQYGHAAGDTCLKVFAERLLASFPQALLTARIGGDEFAMIVGDSPSADLLQARVARFVAQLRAPVLWQGHMLTIAASTGIAVAPDPYSYDPEELFVRADSALYAAKRARRRAEG
jgi:diguanylate cyclase (GGDEF)-like protein/PAS domain S-box-containing protein